MLQGVSIRRLSNALWMLTLGAGKCCEIAEIMAACRERRVMPHVARNESKRTSAIDPRMLRHGSHRVSQVAQANREMLWIPEGCPTHRAQAEGVRGNSACRSARAGR